MDTRCSFCQQCWGDVREVPHWTSDAPPKACCSPCARTCLAQSLGAPLEQSLPAVALDTIQSSTPLQSANADEASQAAAPSACLESALPANAGGVIPARASSAPLESAPTNAGSISRTFVPSLPQVAAPSAPLQLAPPNAGEASQAAAPSAPFECALGNVRQSTASIDADIDICMVSRPFTSQTLDVVALQQERDILRQETETMAIEMTRFIRRHDNVLEQLKNRGMEFAKLQAEHLQACQDKVHAESILFPVQRQKMRLEEDKKFLEGQLSTLATNLEAAQAERDTMFGEKTNAILTLRRQCNTYREQVQALRVDCDSRAIEHAKVSDETTGVDDRFNRNVQMKLRADLERLQRDCEEAQRQKATAECELQQMKDENAELKRARESQKHVERRAIAPLEVSIAKLTAELEAAKAELAKTEKVPTEEDERTMASLRENEARMIAAVVGGEKKLAKSENGRQRALRDVLKAKSQVEILEEKLVKALSPIDGLSVVDILRQNVALESEYRCLVEEQDEKDAEQINDIQRAFLAKQSEFDAALAAKQAELVDFRLKMEDLCQERNSLALELQQQRSTSRSTQPEMDRLLREFRDAKRQLQQEKDGLTVQNNEFRKRERELLEQTEVDRNRLVQLNQKYTSLSMDLQSLSARSFSQTNVVRHLEEVKHECGVKIQKLQEQVAHYRAAKEDLEAQHRLQGERLAAFEREQVALRQEGTRRAESELDARASLEEKGHQFQHMLERLKTQHAEELAKVLKQEEVKTLNLMDELDFAKREASRLEARTGVLDREVGSLRQGTRAPRPTMDVGCLARLKISMEDEKSLRDRILHLEDLVSVRSADAETAKKTLDTLQQDMNQLREQSAQTDVANANLRARATELEIAEKRLKELLWEADKRGESHKERCSKSLRVARMSALCVADMKRLVAAAEQRASDMGQENMMLTKLLDRHKEQSAPSEQQRSQLVEELEKLREEKRLLQQQYRNDTVQMRQQIANCDPHRVEALEQSIAGYVEELKKQQADSDGLRQKCAEQQNDLSTLSLQLSLKDKVVASLQNQLCPDSQLSEALESLEAQCRREIEEGVTRMGTVETEQANATKMQEITTAFERTLQEREGELECQKALVAELQSEREELVNALAVKDAVEHSTGSLETYLREARETYTESVQKEMERSAQLEKKVRATQGEINAWIDKFTKETEKTQESNLRLRSSLAEQEVSVRQIQAMEQTVTSLEKVREDQDVTLRNLHSQLVQLQSEKSVVEMEKILAEEKIASLTRNVGQLVSEKTSVKDVEAGYRLGLEKAKKEYTDALAELQKQEDEKTQALKNRITELESELQTIARNSDLQKKVLAGVVSREKENCAQTFEQKLTEEQTKHAMNMKNLEEHRLKLELELADVRMKSTKEREEMTRANEQQTKNIEGAKALLKKERNGATEKEKRWSEKEKILQARVKQAEEQASASRALDIEQQARASIANKEKQMREFSQKVDQLKAEKVAMQTDYADKIAALRETEMTLRFTLSEKEKAAALTAKENEQVQAEMERKANEKGLTIIGEKEKVIKLGIARNEKLEHQIARLKAENEKLQAERTPHLQDNEEPIKIIAQKNREIKEANTTIAELQEKLAAHTASGSKVFVSTVDPKKMDEEQKQWKEEAEQARHRVAELESSLAQRENASAKIQELEAVNPTDVEKKARILLVEKDKALKAASEKQEKIALEMEKKETELKSAEEKIKELEKRIDSAPAEGSQLHDARVVLASKSKEINQLKAQVKALSAKDDSQWKTQIAQLKSQVQTLQTEKEGASDEAGRMMEFEKLRSREMLRKAEEKWELKLKECDEQRNTEAQACQEVRESLAREEKSKAEARLELSEWQEKWKKAVQEKVEQLESVSSVPVEQVDVRATRLLTMVRTLAKKRPLESSSHPAKVSRPSTATASTSSSELPVIASSELPVIASSELPAMPIVSSDVPTPSNPSHAQFPDSNASPNRDDTPDTIAPATTNATLISDDF